MKRLRGNVKIGGNWRHLGEIERMRGNGEIWGNGEIGGMERMGLGANEDVEEGRNWVNIEIGVDKTTICMI